MITNAINMPQHPILLIHAPILSFRMDKTCQVWWRAVLSWDAREHARFPRSSLFQEFASQGSLFGVASSVVVDNQEPTKT